MTTLAWALLAAAGVAAAVNWVARGIGSKHLEYVFKPATLALLIALAVTLDPTVEAQRWLFVAALALSLAGDVALMLPGDRFVTGLGAFLLAHLLYVTGFVVAGVHLPGLGVGIVLAGVLGATLAVPILAAVDHPRLRAGVVVYMLAIGAMLTTAIGTTHPLAATGAVLFVASDTVLAWNRFVAPLRWASVGIMVTYHAAQALLVLSLAL